MTNQNSILDEQRARALLNKSHAYSGCSSVTGLFGAGMMLLFLLLLLISGVAFLTGGFNEHLYSAVIIMGLCAFFVLIGGMTLWFSRASFLINRKQALASKQYIKSIRERKEAQHGSLSMATLTGEGALNMVAESEESHSTRDHDVSLDLGTSEQRAEMTEAVAHTSPVKK